MITVKSLLLRSKDKSKGVPGNYILPIPFDFKRQTKFRIRSINVPLSYYNVNSNYNTLVTDVGTVNLDEGSYLSGTSLAAELQTKLQVLDASFTATYNSTTNRITIARATNFTIDLTSSTLNEIIGFASTGSLTGTNTYTGTQNFLADPNLNLRLSIKELDRCSNYESSDNKDFLLGIPVNDNIGNYVNYYPGTNEFFTLEDGLNVNQLEIKFYDSNWNIVDFNGVNHTIDLVFYNE